MRGAEEYDDFKRAMDALGLAFHRAMSDQLYALYWSGLEDYPFHAVGRAMTACVKTCKHFPQVAEIRAALNLTVVHSGVRAGTFPPDIADQRRRHHLPVTDDEFREYDRQTKEGGGPLTKADRARIWRESIRTVKNPTHCAAVIKIAERLEAGHDVPDDVILSVFTGAVRQREPGEEG